MKALITGASSGIGKDMAKYLSKKGYELILVARRSELLEKLSRELNTNTEIIICDLSKEKEVYKLYEKVKNKNIDLLINNAGFGLFGMFNKTDLDKELEMIDVNIKSLHILTKLFLIDFTKRDYGNILNVASSAGFLAGPGLSTYYATKNYVLKLTMAIYHELKLQKSNVHISALCPGPVNTEFNKVAKGKFTIKGLSSEYVAKYAIDKTLKNKMIIVPGINIKLGLFFQRFIPYKLLLKIVGDFQKRKGI